MDIIYVYVVGKSISRYVGKLVRKLQSVGALLNTHSTVCLHIVAHNLKYAKYMQNSLATG